MKKIDTYILKLFYYSFPLFIIVQYFAARGWISSNPTVTIVKIAILIVGIKSILKIKIKSKNKGFYLMSFFILYTLFSGIAYVFSNRPFFCYYDALTNYILPMLMFYIGMNPNINQGKFIRLMSLGLIIGFILTIPAYVTLAPWYVDFIKKSFENSSQSIDYVMSALRFGGPFADNYLVMYTSVPLLAYYLNEVFVNQNKNFINYLSIIIYVIALILCQQRSGLLFTILAFPYFIYYSKNRSKNFFYFFIILFILLMIIAYNASSRMDDIITLLTDRIEKMSFEEAFGERREKVFRVFSEWKNILFGDGVGVYSHAAFSKGFVSVNDNGWIKLLVENGFVGVCSFLWLSLSTLYRGIKFKKYFYVEIFIVSFFLFAMIGSDSLSMDSTQPILFWLSMGLIWSPKKRKVEIQ